jgi:hypothetical protein
MTEIDQPPDVPHGATRLETHPLLGSLPPASPIAFTVDGRPLSGRLGEPILAALLAGGLRTCRTMPLDGGARGGYCLVGRCPDCLMQVDGELNVRTCLTPLREGMRVVTQHGLGTWETPSDEPPDPASDGGAA